MKKIIDYEGTPKQVSCIGCHLKRNKKDLIFETNNFLVMQDFEIPIKGFLVISSKRHIIGVGDFNNDEKLEFIELLSSLRKLLGKVLRIKYFDYLYSEKTFESEINPSHFHIALLPNYSWMKGMNYKEILSYAKNNLRTEKNIAQIKKINKKIKNLIL